MKELEQLILSKSRPVQKEAKYIGVSELDKLIMEALLGEQQEKTLGEYDAARRDRTLSADTIYFVKDPSQLGIPTKDIKGSDMERAEHFLVEGLISAGLGLPEPSKVSGPLPNLTAQFIINTAKAGYELGKQLKQWNITRDNTYVAGKMRGKLSSAFTAAGVSATSITDIFIGGEPTTVKNAKSSQLTVQEPMPLKLVVGKLLKDFQEDEVFDLFADQGEIFTVDSEALANFFKEILEKYEQAFDLDKLSIRFNKDDAEWDQAKQGFKYKTGEVVQLPDIIEFTGKYDGKRPILGLKAGKNLPAKEADLLNYMTGFGSDPSRQRGAQMLAIDPTVQAAIEVNQELVNGYLEAIEKTMQSVEFKKQLAREFTTGEMKFEAGSAAIPKYILYFDPENSTYKFEVLDDKYFEDYVENYFKLGFRAGKGPRRRVVGKGIKQIFAKRFGTLRPETGDVRPKDAKAKVIADKSFIRLNEGLLDSIKSEVKKIISFVKSLFSTEEKEKIVKKAATDVIADELLTVAIQPVTIETDNSVRV